MSGSAQVVIEESAVIRNLDFEKAPTIDRELEASGLSIPLKSAKIRASQG
jgi:hypothetical protein